MEYRRPSVYPPTDYPTCVDKGYEFLFGNHTLYIHMGTQFAVVAISYALKGITQLVDSISRDGLDTPIYVIQNPKSSVQLQFQDV